MKYINTFKTHASYEENLNGGVDISLPNISYCEDVKDVHYNPYNTVEFYVGEITSSEIVKIYTDANNHVDITIDKGNKWYSYVLPKDKGLYKIESGIYNPNYYWWELSIVEKAVVKANISYSYDSNNDKNNGIVPYSTIEASFKGSNTSNVTNMESMFNECRGLTSLDVSNFDTSNVTNMGNMFNRCGKLTSLDVSNFVTSKVTKMNGMFRGCIGLKSLNVNNFDTSNVTNMSSMFDGCSGLTSLDVSNFDTSNVTRIGMFGGCSGLKSLDLSNFVTNNVTSMAGMFSDCSGLTSLDLRNFNTSNVTDMSLMFGRCTSLTSLDLRNFNTSNVTNMGYMFSDCSGLTSLDLSGWDTSKVTTPMHNMFMGCNALKTIRMVGCSTETINAISGVKPSSATTIVTE